MTTELLGLADEELTALLSRCGDGRPYRRGQVLRWLYQRDAASVETMSDLPRPLRERLSEEASIGRLAPVRHDVSGDGTRKFLFRLAGGHTVETVVLRHPGRHTGCISTQAGCGMGCTFCASAVGLRRNLTAGEIVEQVMAARREARVVLTNLVFMGMGEPLANYEAVVRAAGILTAPWGLAFGPRQITVSTVGLAPAIQRLAEENPPFNLAVSLHATTDAVRSRIMPINRGIPVAQLLAACQEYVRRTGRLVTFEFLLLAGVNDSDDEAVRLAAITKTIRSKVNVIPYNPVPGLPYERPPQATVLRFCEILARHGAFARLRETRGSEIAAACGQLRADYERPAAVPAEAVGAGGN